MPVTTRRQVQTAIPFKCRKTRNSSRTKCSPVDKSERQRGEQTNAEMVQRSDKLNSCTTVSKDSPMKGSSCGQQSKMDDLRDCSPCTKPLSPRKRNLPEEPSSNDRIPTPRCSPRKLKKENIPVSSKVSSVLKPNHVTTSCDDVFKPLNPALLHQTRLSPTKKPISAPIVSESVRLTSPLKRAVRSLKLERVEGEIYQKAKQAFHIALPERLVGRDKEIETMRTFLQDHLAKHQPGSLYISGAPGTGKTACLSQVLSAERKLQSKVEVIFVNCMSVKKSQSIYAKILGELSTDICHAKITAKDAARKLQKTFTTSGPMVVLVLDEVDHLDSKGQEVLYTMFEWPALPKSRLLLIGVANALDLTDRILPRLQARPRCKPQLLHFSPYNKDQIAAILLDRLRSESCDGSSVVEPIAMQLCARKVAAAAGDVRKALDVCRRAVEIVECDVKSQLRLSYQSPVRNASPSKHSASLKKVGVKQVSSVISEVYGSHLATTSNQSQALPLQQKIMLCTILMMVRGGRLKEVTLGKCHEFYSKLCKDRQVPSVEQSEFLSLCQLVESRGLIGLKNTKDTRQTKLSLRTNEKEVEMALQDKVLLSTILQGDTVTKTFT